MSVSQSDEWAAVTERFAVDVEQVRRDHLISHLLGAIAAGVSKRRRLLRRYSAVADLPGRCSAQ